MRRRLLLANSHGGGWSEKTMTFYVNGIAYTAYEGMTWGDWITSEFNIDAFYIYADGRVCNAGDVVLYGMVGSVHRAVTERDYIITDYQYKT